MQFPSSDPLWIIEAFKLAVITVAAIVLLYRWYRAERHFYTDIPFLIALTLLFFAAGEGVDAIFHSGIAPYVLTLFKVRSSLLGCGLFFAMYATVIIWLYEHKRLGYLLLALYLVFYLAAAWLAPTEDLVRLWTMPFILVMFVAFVVTFTLAWAKKRLPDVHGLVMSLGGCVAVVGQLLKNPLAAIGIMWVSELIDLLGLGILFLGLVIKPGYAKVAEVPSIT